MQDLELRVLSGLHHGARCTARDGALLGSHDDCDVILGDDGIAEKAVRLWVGDIAWRLSAHDDPTDTSGELSFGTPFPLGPVHVTVARAADPWPDPAELSMPQDAAEDSRNDSAHDTMAHLDPDAARGNQTMSMHSRQDRPVARRGEAVHPKAGRRRKGTGSRWAVGGLLILLVFGSVASFSPPAVRSNPRMEVGPGADADSLSRVRRLLLEQGYSHRIQATLTADREVLVTGWIRDEMEHDGLATALSAIWPLPAMRVDNETQAAGRVVSRAQDLDVRVEVDYPAPGQLSIRGIAASDEVRTEALERWRADDDASPRIAATLLVASQVSAALDEAVAAAGLPHVPSTWKDKALRVAPRGFDVTQCQRLGGILDALNSTYMNALTLGQDDTPPAPSIPFRVHSVVGGGQPWVMLEDGTRIVIGGTHGAYRLTSIEDGSVVFDGPAKTVIPR
jgi:type III secretion protein D